MHSELNHAVRSGDPLAARRVLGALAEAGSAGREDDGTNHDDTNSPVMPARVLETLAQMAAAGGDGAPLATELLIENLDASGLVHRFAHQALLDHAAVDDVTQDSLISIAESIGSFRGNSQLSTWVHRIVRNRVVDHLRRQRATAPLPADDMGPGVRISSVIATRATITEVLGLLPAHYREPVVLRDVQGLSYTEVAQRLGVGLSTTKSRVARGRALVAAHWHEGDDRARRSGRCP
ncbi:RNA polymerase sigma factor [Pseudactinotalea sp. Z1748]|uniref:RNA polymerase sigma factor n=1 Tax=Pseudactinotalea sp. Z1748 TaxID=3413027 RepID=UPI003C7C1665